MKFSTKKLQWFREWKTNPRTKLHIYLLKNCPYSQSLAHILKQHPMERIEKKWVQRDSKNFYQFKEMYQSETYPIVVVSKEDEQIHLGGFTEFNDLLKKMA